jgi:hypothetical protein
MASLGITINPLVPKDNFSGNSVMLRKPYVTLSHQPRTLEVMGGHSKAGSFAEYTVYFILAPNR